GGGVQEGSVRRNRRCGDVTAVVYAHDAERIAVLQFPKCELQTHDLSGVPTGHREASGTQANNGQVREVFENCPRAASLTLPAIRNRVHADQIRQAWILRLSLGTSCRRGYASILWRSQSKVAPRYARPVSQSVFRRSNWSI